MSHEGAGIEKFRQTFEQSIEKGKNEALDLIKKRFEEAEEPRDNLEFHNRSHTRDVIRRVETILAALHDADPEHISKRDIALGGFAAAFHDTVQAYVVTENGMRKRKIIENEKASGDEAITEIQALRKTSANENIISEKEEHVIREAINATVPGFDPVAGTVVQPNLTEQSDALTRALALADLGTAGMDGPEAFIREGNALFREENLDIKEALSKAEALTEDKEVAFRKRMLAWSAFQPKFAEGRKMRLDQEIKGLTEPAKDAIEKLFTTFYQTISAANDKSIRRQGMSFKELARDMGYSMK